MKKVLLIIGIIVSLLIVIILIALPLRYDEESLFEDVDTVPEGLVRTIENPYFDDRVTFLKKSAETAGAYTLLEIELGPGGGNTPHYHRRFSETFIAIDGVLGVELEGENIYLEPGNSITAEKNVVHRFFNPGDERILFHVKTEPGSTGFEKALYILYGLANDGLTDEKGGPADINHIAVFVHLSDTHAPGFLGFMAPVFRWLAQRAEKSGLQDELLDRYYFGHTE